MGKKNKAKSTGSSTATNGQPVASTSSSTPSAAATVKTSNVANNAGKANTTAIASEIDDIFAGKKATSSIKPLDDASLSNATPSSSSSKKKKKRKLTDVENEDPANLAATSSSTSTIATKASSKDAVEDVKGKGKAVKEVSNTKPTVTVVDASSMPGIASNSDASKKRRKADKTSEVGSNNPTASTATVNKATSAAAKEDDELFRDSRGISSRRKTDDGLPIYDIKELNIGLGGDTELCPFDLKRLAAPSSWMLDKLGGTYAPRPSPGPHKLRESLPLSIFLKNKLKYALTGREVTLIVAQRLVKVDGKVRTDNTYPAGFMDVISIDKSGEHFRLLYDVKGRFAIHRISPEEAKYKLCKVKRVQLGAKGIPYIVTHDGRTIRYPDPAIKVNDTIKLLLPQTTIPPATAGAPNPTAVEISHRIDGFLKFEVGNLVMVTGGRNMGRAGTIVHKERHIGGFDIVHVRDVQGHDFATRLSNIFVIGEGPKPWVSLPRGSGVKLSIAEERDQRRKQKEKELA